MKKSNNIILKVLGVFFLFFIIGYTINFLTKEKQVGIDELYQKVEDKNVLVNIEDCQLPNEKIGIHCCIPAKDYPVMCEDEFNDFFKKLNESIANKDISEDNLIYDNNYKFSFKSPKDYLIVQDITEGGITIPYFFIYYGADSEGYYDFSKYMSIEIIVLPKEFTGVEEGWGFDIKSDFESFEKGLNNGTTKMEQVLGLTQTSETKRFIETNKNKEAFVTESKVNANNQIFDNLNIYSKRVVFLDRPIMIYFEATPDFEGYVSEFDDVVNSIDFSYKETK